MLDPRSRPHLHSSPPEASRGAEASPVDVAALCERVRRTARSVGERARGSLEPLAFPVPEDANPDHHLWRNGGVWWIAFTAHAGVVQERVRFSLGTDDVGLARLRRDVALRLFAEAGDLGISLRFRPQARTRGCPGSR